MTKAFMLAATLGCFAVAAANPETCKEAEGDASVALQVSGEMRKQNLCSCTTNGFSNNVYTGMVGCAEHDGDGRTFCYIVSAHCPGSLASTRFPGAHYIFNCHATPSCPGDLQYMECGTSCQSFCGGPPPMACTRQCVPGCQCPRGKYRMGDRCYDAGACPDPCGCTETGNSGSVHTPYVGCADHLGNGKPYCYTTGNECSTAYPSQSFPGAMYKYCHNCPGDLEYQECGTACPLVCGGPVFKCAAVCVAECQCPRGKWRVGGTDTCVEESQCPKKDDDCECAVQGMSGGVNTGTSGCSYHDFGSTSWCYVAGGTKCRKASRSLMYPGAAWRDCSISIDGPGPEIAIGRPLKVDGQSLLASVLPMRSAVGSSTDEWGLESSDLGRVGSGGFARRLMEEALRAAGWSSNPLPHIDGTLTLEARLPETLVAAKAELADASAEDVEEWHLAGLAEHASVGSFAKLCLELLVAGAPPRVLRQAIRAQEEELMHAHISLGLRGQQAGRGSTGTQLEIPEHTLEVRRDHAAMRAAAITEGVVGEGHACLKLFAKALKALAGEASPGQRALAELTWAMAQDEARHAALGLEVTEWLQAKPLEVQVSGGEVRLAEI